MMKSWDDIRIFLATARGESLSAAGRQLKMDPATVGRRIARLEEDFGTPLFAKSPQGYAMTEAGTRLMAHAEEAEQAMQAAEETVAGRTEGIAGQIRIGAPDGCANYLLPQVCARIALENPDLDVQIVALPRVVNLSKREVDMAIAVSAPTAGRLTVQRICDYKLHLAASRRYVRMHGAPETLEDLRAHRIVGYIPDMIFDKELDYLENLGVERVPLASNSASVQLRWVATAAGIGILHDFALPQAGRMVRLLTEELSLTRSFYLLVKLGAQALSDLTEGMREEVARLEGLT